MSVEEKNHDIMDKEHNSSNTCNSHLMHMQTHCLYLHFINARIPSGVCLLLSPPLLLSRLLSFLLLSALVLSSLCLYSLLPFPPISSPIISSLPFPQRKKKTPTV